MLGSWSPPAKGSSCTPSLDLAQKLTLSIDLNVRAKIVKLLVESVGVDLHDAGFGDGFLVTTPGAETKEKNR